MIVIVTGMGRSGTSLMMRMLEAGGIPADYNDEHFPPDYHNPRGYYERNDMDAKICNRQYLESIQGSAIKVWPQYLERIPSITRDEIIVTYMVRPDTQRWHSFQRRIKDRPTWWKNVPYSVLERLNSFEVFCYDADADRARLQSTLRSFHADHTVFYPELINDPIQEAQRLKIFLNRNGFVDFDMNKAIDAVDPALWRNR